MNDQIKSGFSDPSPEGGVVAAKPDNAETPAAPEQKASSEVAPRTPATDEKPTVEPQAETKSDSDTNAPAKRGRGRPPSSNKAFNNDAAVMEMLGKLADQIQKIDERLSTFTQSQQAQVINLNRTIATMKSQPTPPRDPMNSPPLRQPV